MFHPQRYNIDNILNSRKDTHSSPPWVSYGMSLLIILNEIHLVWVESNYNNNTIPYTDDADKNEQNGHDNDDEILKENLKLNRNKLKWNA